MKAGDAPLPNLTALLHDWAIDLGHTIVDNQRLGQLIRHGRVRGRSLPAYPCARHYRETSALLTAFPLAQSITPVSGGVNGRTAQTLHSESTASADAGTRWIQERRGAAPCRSRAALSVTAPSAPATPQESKPEAAPKDAPPKPETRVAVIGDSDFASNALLGVEGNRDMFLNTMNWLSQQESLISIRPKDPEDRRLTLTASEQVAVRWLALLVVPALIWGAGIYNWSRRRG